MTEILTSQTPPILHGPSEKEKKYDRQLRLWAASGQAALESAHILLVNSGAGTVGVEALKNLVLPGIGRFTIADNAVVNDADLGVNFFLDESCRGRLRSECCTKLLEEMNPEVQGDWYPKTEASGRFLYARQQANTGSQETFDLAGFLQSASRFTLIMYTNPILKTDLETIEAYSTRHKTPVVSVHSAGFYSYFRLGLPGTFPIVETHPEERKTTDLRLLNPWLELVHFALDMTEEIDALDDHEHGHLPYVIILLHYLKEWRVLHDGSNPTSLKAKREFENFVRGAMRTNNAEGGEENFQEAVGAINTNVKVPELEPELQEVFSHEISDETELRSAFWVIAGAIKKFYQKYGCLPLSGSLPDMKAQSSVYVKLQSIYKAKARRDAEEVLEMVRANPGGKDVDPMEVELFCKNARFVKLINAQPLVQDVGQVFESERLNDEAAEAMNLETDGAFSPPLSTVPIYLALLATAHNPTASADEIMNRVAQLVPAAANQERVRRAAQEVARAAGGELHNISALTGGMVAQEVIKTITKQYIPIDNTCIFDGIGSRCQVLRL